MTGDQWKPTPPSAKYGVAIYNFRSPACIRCGLSVNIGDTVFITEECKDWYRGKLTSDLSRKGIFPKQCIKLKEATVANEGPFEVITPVVEPVINEVTSSIREWGVIMKELFLERKFQVFNALKDTMNSLIGQRREIIFGKLTKDQQKELKEKITNTIDSVNRRLNLDLVPRIDGEIIEGDSTSVVELYQIHVNSSKNVSRKNRSSRKTTPTVVPAVEKRMSIYGTMSKRPPVSKAPTSHHLFISFKSFMCNIGEASTLLFALYDAKTGNYMSERYIVKLTKHGMPVEIELLGKQFGIFQDLTTADLSKSAYLVCKIFREGKLVDSKKHGNAEYRRPFGAGAIDVSDVLLGEIEDEKELNIPIYNCNEGEFHMLEDFIIRRQSGKYNTFGSNSNFGICVDIKMFHGDVEKIIKEKGTCSLSPRLGFPEVILPGYVRNDFYVTLKRADFDRGSKSTGKNIEVALCVVSNRGQIFNDCMSIGSGVKPVSEYRSHVLYHSNTPNWNETIKVFLPIEQFHTAHLRFTYSHCSRNEGKVKGERIFGFSFMKLLKEDGTVTKDGDYELFIYKFDNAVDFFKVNSYLRLPNTALELAAQEKSGVVFAGPQRNPKEYVGIKTYLCSTRLTQNSDIVNLLQWRKLEQNEVLGALESLLKVSPEEVVKFLQDIFDALFKILSEMHVELSLPVFKALVSITKIVEEPKYASFKSTLNSYVEEHFSATLAYRSLANSLCHVIQNFNDLKLRTTLTYTIKSLTYIFKMIVRSYQLHFSATQNVEVLSEVKELMDQIFASLITLAGSVGEAFNDIKMEVLKQLPNICNDVLQVYSEKDYSEIINNFLGAIPKNASGVLQVQKLNCLRNVVETNLFIHKDGRTVLMQTVVRQLVAFMERKLELGTCLDLLGDVITALEHIDNVYDDVSLLSCALLGVELNVLLTIDRRSSTTGLSVACLLGILKLMEEGHYKEYIEMYNNKGELRDFLKKLTVAFKELLTLEIFPKDWFVLRTVGNNVILTAVQYFSKAFTDYFLTDEYFDQTLWDNYFHLSVLFLVHPSLHLESFQNSKRVKIMERYGDMRRVMGFEVLAMWEVLGSKKKQFIPGMIGSFLEMTLVPDMELRRATIPIFYDMMKVEFAENHNFKKVEAELMEKLELLMNKNKGDLEYQELFEEIMSEKFQSCLDPQLYDEGLKSIRSITELLKRLLDYRAAIDGDSSIDVKMMCTFRLLEFYEQFPRKDMYIKCIYKLVELHDLCNNYSEAGFTLKLHASLLEWSDTELVEFLKFPKQLEWQRKEQLYLEIIDYFDKGKTWESGINLCKELAILYENKIVDYTKLSEILRKQAYFYDNIMKQIRPAPTYFRVSFYGRGFPHYLKDEVLVYRGEELETLAGFTTRIRSEFPSSEILYKNTPPDASIVQGIGQHIQICNVTPLTSEVGIADISGVDERIASYYRSNEVSEFVFSRPFHRGDKDPNNEFKTLHLERTVQWTKRKFPNILKWSTIDSTRKTELTPIENATEMILSKNRELESTIEEFSSLKKSNINQLGMILNGVIDANVNGGIANYQNAFLCEEYLFLNPEDKDKINHLKLLLHDQSHILSRGLQVHERLLTDALRPFHDHMVMSYSAMKVSIETGQPMESVLARPSSLQVSSTIGTPGRSSPGKNSPRESPSEIRRLINFSKSPSEGEISQKKESKKSISASLQNILRRTSIQIPESRTHTGHDTLKPSPLAAPPPIPARRNELDAGSPAAGVPSDVSQAALKRLGLGPSSALTASAPSLVSIEEENRPSLPPKSKNKRHTDSGDIHQQHNKIFNSSMDSVFTKPDDLINNNDLNSRQSTSSPLLPQSTSVSHEEEELNNALDELKRGFPSNDSSLASSEDINGLGEDSGERNSFGEHTSQPSELNRSISPPVPKPRVRRPSDGGPDVINTEPIQPIPPVKKPRPSVRNSINENDTIPENEPIPENCTTTVDDEPPPPLPKKLTRKLSQDIPG